MRYVSNKQGNWQSKEFSESPVSSRLLEHFDKKFPQTLSPLVLCKCLATVSCKLERPRFSMLHVAPPRQCKSHSSDEVKKIFAKEFYIDLGSDFTIHSLPRYKDELNAGRCLFLNDVTILFVSKVKRGKERLVGELSELLADEIYTYQDFQKKFKLEGSATLVGNITSESHKNHKDRLFGSTFSERVLTFHHVLAKPEMDAWVAKEEKSKNIHFEDKITVDDIETNVKEIPPKYLDLIRRQAREFSYLSLRGFIGCQDLIKGIVRAHASLNKRQEVYDDDFKFLAIMKGYLINPFSPYEGKIVTYAAQGMSYRSICKQIGKPASYVRQVYDVVQKARIRGILPPEHVPPLGQLDEKTLAHHEKCRGGA